MKHFIIIYCNHSYQISAGTITEAIDNFLMEAGVFNKKNILLFNKRNILLISKVEEI